MEKSTTGRWDNVKAALWFIAILEALVVCLAIICGPACGFRNTFIAFTVSGVLLGVLLVGTVIAVEVSAGLMRRAFRHVRKRRPDHGSAAGNAVDY